MPDRTVDLKAGRRESERMNAVGRGPYPGRVGQGTVGPMPPDPLDGAALGRAAALLARRDPDLAGILARHGPPPLWARPPGLATLIAIVLEQQVSLRSGAAALERLDRAAGALDPAAIVDLGEDGARAAGITRQKARYVVALAVAALDGRFDPTAIAAATDADARDRLTSLLGVGRWTADIYLLMALGRPDIWPTGDLALAAAMGRAKSLARLPDRVDQETIAAAWKPWRAVAARLLWQAYLAGER